MSNKAPINDLQELVRRKEMLRSKIEVQERTLSKDLDAYQDDIDTFKKLWSGVKGIRNFKENFSTSGIGKAVNIIKALPFGKNTLSSSGGVSGWGTALTIGTEVIKWIMHWWKKKKKK